MTSSFSVRFLLLSLLFISCSNDRGHVLTFWALGAEGEHVQKIVKKFEEKNPDVKVKVQQIPWTAAHEKLLTAFAGNSLPDICQLGNTWIPEFTLIGALEPLDKYVTSSNIVKKENFFEGVWETNVYDSKVMGIPWYVDTRVLFYRTDILKSVGFDNAPKTWDEMLEVCNRIKREKGKYGIFLPTNEWQPLILFALEAGAKLLKNSDSQANFNDENFLTALEFLRKFYRLSYSPSSWLEVQNVYQGFAEGYVSMYITGPWNIGEFKRRLPKEVQDKWMTSPMPGKNKFPGVSIPGGSSLVIFKSSKNKNSAWRLIEFLSEPKNQVEFYKLTGDLPAVVKAWEDSVLKMDPYLKAFFIQLQNLKPLPKVAEWEQIAMKLVEYVELSAVKDIHSKEIAEMINSDVDKMLEKRRWILKRTSNEY
jgi:multiple sugar transport system substrate-binding protein